MPKKPSSCCSLCNPADHLQSPQSSLKLLRGRDAQQVLSSINLHSSSVFDAIDSYTETPSVLLSPSNPFSRKFRNSSEVGSFKFEDARRQIPAKTNKEVSVKNEKNSSAGSKTAAKDDRTRAVKISSEKCIPDRSSKIRNDAMIKKCDIRPASSVGQKLTVPDIIPLNQHCFRESHRIPSFLASYQENRSDKLVTLISKRSTPEKAHGDGRHDSQSSSDSRIGFDNGLKLDRKDHYDQMDFSKIRTEWSRIVKAIENYTWKVGNREQHERHLEKFFREAQLENRYTDVVIATSDHRLIHAHALVLASHSKAFARRLIAMSSGAGVPTLYKLSLTNKVNSLTVTKVVDWMYRGHTRIAAVNLPDVTHAAKYFGSIPLVVECLRRKVELERSESKTENYNLSQNDQHYQERKAASEFSFHPAPHPQLLQPCTLAFNPSRQRSLLENDDSVAKFSAPGDGKKYLHQDSIQKKEEVFSNFSRSSSSNSKVFNVGDCQKICSSILSMTAEEVKQFLDDDSLKIQSELEVLEAIVRWISASPLHREIYLSQLLDCVRLYHVTDDELKCCFKVHPEYFKLPVFRNVLGQAFRAKSFLDVGQGAAQFKPNRCKLNEKS